MSGKLKSLSEASALINNDSIVTVSSSSGLGCPDAVLQALGERFRYTGQPRNLTTLHPIAAGDMSGIKGIDHIAQEGLLARTLCGSFPSGPSSAQPPAIWQMIGGNSIAAYNVPSGILFDMHREAAAKRPGVLTKVGFDTFVDPAHEGCAMNAAAAVHPIVRRVDFEGEEYLYFPAIAPDVAIIRATTADERGNLTFEHEGAYLGALEQALAAHNHGGLVIAQVKEVVAPGRLRAHDVRVPGVLVDVIVCVPEQMQTTQTQYDPAISGEQQHALDEFELPALSPQKAMARRVAMELRDGWVVNIGFGISANVPRILLEEGLHGATTWVLEQGAVGGVPLLGFKFGCAANAEAYMPSPQQFTYFQAAGFDATLLSFMQIGADGSVNVSRLAKCPHVTAGAGGFVDITARARRIVFSGLFDIGSKVHVDDGKIEITQRGKISKLVKTVEQISFSGTRALAQGQQVAYVTERCVMELRCEGVTVTEIAPGADLERDVLQCAGFQLRVADDLKLMPAALFHNRPMKLKLMHANG